MTALVALTERVLRGTFRDADLLFAVLAPIACFVGFTLMLRNVIDTGGMSYAQYVLPAIVVQAMLFSAMTTADRAARDNLSGMGIRLQTLPIAAVVPLMARMTYCLLRGVITLAAALGAAYVFGFRMTGGIAYGIAFVLVALTLTLALSLGADAVGSRVKSVEASSQLMVVPQLLLVLVSTGMAPAASFPDWLGPFVRNQPVSQVTETLRDLAGGHIEFASLAVSLAWCLGLLVVFGAVALRMQRRTR
jgi:ABC-2 type transport system permease protein